MIAMSDSPEKNPRDSIVVRQMLARANRAETVAMVCIGLGAFLLAIGTILVLVWGGGLLCLLFGGLALVVGFIENVRAEVLHVRARLEKD
jgi:hypothetical protein